MYAPVIESARAIKRYRFGPYEAAFLDQIVAKGPIGYEFIIVVFEEGATDPFLFVTSERNKSWAKAKVLQELGLEPDMNPINKGESHFLCLFDKQGHHNLGASNDWSDAAQFEVAALRILTEWLGREGYALWTKGIHLKELGQVEEALRHFDRVTQIDSGFEEAWVEKAILLQNLTRIEEALVCYDHALTINPQNQNTWYNKATLFINAFGLISALPPTNGPYPEAIACLERAQALGHPHAAPVLEVLLGFQSIAKMTSSIKDGELTNE